MGVVGSMEVVGLGWTFCYVDDRDTWSIDGRWEMGVRGGGGGGGG